MISRKDSGSDLVVSLDAFKITRHGVGGPLGEAGRWHVKPLTPWARTTMADPRAFDIVTSNKGWPLKPADGDQPTDTATAEAFGHGLGFERLMNAKGFLSDLEDAAAGWWRSATVATYASSMITDTINAGPYDDEDFHRVKVSGKLETKWFNASPAQLAAIAEIMRTEA